MALKIRTVTFHVLTTCSWFNWYHTVDETYCLCQTYGCGYDGFKKITGFCYEKERKSGR